MSEEKTKGTLYKVFHSNENGITLEYIGDVTALNDLAAVKKVASTENGASYVAVPARNLRVRTVQVVSEPKVTVS